MPSPSTDPFFLRNALATVQAQDWETLESLRSDLRPEHVPEIVKSWRPTLPWPIKDAYAMLLMDQTGDAVRPVMEDALHSPTPETRAYALCSLSGSFDLFDSLLTSSMVDERLVDAAIQRYRASRR
jgi:hypothetical protein